MVLLQLILEIIAIAIAPVVAGMFASFILALPVLLLFLVGLVSTITHFVKMYRKKEQFDLLHIHGMIWIFYFVYSIFFISSLNVRIHERDLTLISLILPTAFTLYGLLAYFKIDWNMLNNGDK